MMQFVMKWVRILYLSIENFQPIRTGNPQISQKGADFRGMQSWIPAFIGCLHEGEQNRYTKPYVTF